MLGYQLTFDDFKQTFPELGKGLQQLLDFEGDVEDVYCRTFQAETEAYGKIFTHDLKENGGDIPVTNQNRREFVDLYVNWKLNQSIQTQFDSFFNGFKMVLSDQQNLNLFRPEELELLICGNPVFDFEELENYTKYSNGFSKKHSVIINFWECVHEFTQEEKKKFLQFCTGSDRIPIKGLKELNFVIVKNGDDSDRLPTAHTCFNHLLLPTYSTKEKLRERLLTAISNCSGFGLQ
jgi:ubiquitin-protein ligase E3 A